MEFEVSAEEDLEARLVAAQMKHAFDLMRSEIETVKALQDHYKQCRRSKSKGERRRKTCRSQREESYARN